MKEQHDWISRGDLFLLNKLHKEGKNNWYSNKYHLSSYSGAMGNPAGLVLYKGWYYIFFENCPYSDERLIPSWGLYMTTDFIHFEYRGITITPSTNYDKDGAYGGNAFIEAGQLYFYYTGLMELKDYGTTTTFVMKAQLNLRKETVYKKMLLGQDLSNYSGHYCDPMVFHHHGGFYMLNGAQNKPKQGVISLVGGRDRHLLNWEPIHNLAWPNLTNLGALKIEAPGYAKIDGAEVIYFSACKKPTALENCNAWYQAGCFSKVMEFKEKGNLQRIDYGYDFFAPQFFQNTSDSWLMMAWLGNPNSRYSKSLPALWQNQLSFPRTVIWKDLIMYQQPHKTIEKLRLKPLGWAKHLTYTNGLIELNVRNIIPGDFHITIRNEKGEKVIITYQAGDFLVNRSEMTLKDNYNLPVLKPIKISEITNLRVLIDRSTIEIFINDGRYTISTLFFVNNHEHIDTDLINGEAYQLKGYVIDEDNNIFINNLSHIR